MKRLIALAASAAIAGAMSAPALAQDDAGDRVNTVIIYGDDECPQSEGDTITVCARMDESERYRIPPNLRESDDPSNQAWAERVRSFEAVGKFGPLSCSNSGTGSELGCTIEMIEAAYEERERSQNVRFSQLINEARQERLSEIDAEAAATQRRVEELERQYMERLENERDAPLPGEAEVDTSTPPAEVANPDRLPPSDLPEPEFEDDADTPRPVDSNAPSEIGGL